MPKERCSLMLIRVCDVNLLRVDEPRSFRVNGVEIMLILQNGSFHCLAGRCTHAGAPLSEGTLNGEVLTCPWHYSQFNIASGKVLHGPAGKPLEIYSVKVMEGSLFVDL